MNNRFSKNTLCSTLLAAVLTFANNAGADAPLSGNLYAGVGVAQSRLQINRNNITALNGPAGQATLESNGFGLDAFVGYKFDELVGLELGVIDMGSTNLNNGVTTQEFMDVSSVYLDVILSHGLSNSTDVFVKVGISSWEIQSENTISASDGTGLHYGAGLDINLYNDKSRALRIKWEHHEFDDLILNNTNSISASIVFNL